MFWKIAKIGDNEVIGFAADELKKYLAKMDGSMEYVIMSFEKYEPSLKDALWLGMDEHFPCPQVKDRELDDGVAIEVHGISGYITGPNSRSILIGAYRFLKELGCAFVRPGADGEIIPQKSLRNVEVSVFEAASYRHRGICIEGAVSAEHILRNIDWLPKVGMNAFFNQFQVPFTFYDRWYTHKYNPYLEEESFTYQDAEGIMRASIFEIKKRGLLCHAAGHGWTCEPFGLEGSGWDVKDYDVPEETKPYLALVNGKRELWGNIPLNTNLCYSSEYVQTVMTNAVADYCVKYPQVDILHVWLADGMNNHCECENCKDTRPADFYVELLNRIDASLTEKGIKTKIVFLTYLDLLWEPEKTKLQNPDRFILMFAPITRTYAKSLADAEPFDRKKLAPYVRNHASYPENVSENLERFFVWQDDFKGDTFLYDYHYMWDHFFDPGYYSMAKILYKDMKHLDKYGLNGMMSCQNHRVFLPTALGMVAMARVLWDKTISFERIAKEYFEQAFGKEGEQVEQYLATLSDLFQPPYLRGECDSISEEIAEKFAQIPDAVDRFQQQVITPVLEKNEDLYAAQKSNWENLLPHGGLCKRLAKTYELLARGEVEKVDEALEEAKDFVCRFEAELHHVFDMFLFYNSVAGKINGMKEKIRNLESSLENGRK